MDEEELGQSNKKITIDNFFESISSIDEVANRALQQSQENFNLVSVNSNLLQGLEESIQLIESDIQQITNYFIVQQDQRRKQLEIREQELSKRQDISQKQIGGRLQDVAPFENRPRNFGDSLLQGAAGLAQNTIRPFIGPGVILGLSGLLGFKDGGEPPINKPAIVGEEGPEIFVPKTSGTIIPNNIINELNTSISYSTRGNPETGQIEVDPNSLEYPFMLEAATQQFYQDKVQELESQIFDAKLEAKAFGKEANVSELEKKLNMYKGKYDDTLEYGTRYGVGGNKDNKEDDKEDDKEGGFFKNLFSKKKNENVKSDDKENKGLFDGLFGGNKKNENVRSDEKEGRGLFGAIGGTIDAATGNLTDFDKRGGKPFGLMRGITGSIDAMTGGLTDLDRRGGKPFGLMRLATGVADAMTGNLFDFDRRGRGEEEKKKLRDKDGRYIGDNARKKNFQNKIDSMRDKESQLSMETTVNPDGSITSKGSGTFIAGEIVRPGEPLTPMQRAAMTMGLQMGNTYSPEIMEKYNNSGGSPSKEEFDIKGDKAPVRSEDFIKSVFESQVDKLTLPPNEDLSAITLPPISSGGNDEPIETTSPTFETSNSQSDQITGTESGIPFIDVISNPFLSVV
mgnify:CR=1 FL=1